MVMAMMMIGLVMTMMVMMIRLVRGQFVHCQLPPPPVNKTGATALPHMGIGMSLRGDDDDGIPFHFDAADAEDSDEGAEEDETGHGENRHLLLVIIGIVTISIIVNMTIISITSTDPRPSASSGCARETSRTPRLVSGRGASRVNSSWWRSGLLAGCENICFFWKFFIARS